MMIACVYDFTNWQEKFADYLKENGHKPSVIKDYVRRIETILETHDITIEKLSAQIDEWIDAYMRGEFSDTNKRRHYAPSSALKKFKDFKPVLQKPFEKSNADPWDIYTKNPPNIIY